MVSDINAAITILYGLPTPTVAAVNGHAIGAGFVVMLACDARLATDADTKLGLTEVTAGIPYPACPMEVVNAEIEPSCRRHLVLSGEIISSHAAQVRGLLDDVVAHQELLDRAVELARLRAAAPSYPQVKDQLKHDTLSRMREIVATSRDPMLEHWVWPGSLPQPCSGSRDGQRASYDTAREIVDVGGPLRDFGGVVDRREAGPCSAHADNKLGRGRHDGCLRSEGVPGCEFPRVGHDTRGLPFPSLASGRLLATTKAVVTARRVDDCARLERVRLVMPSDGARIVRARRSLNGRRRVRSNNPWRSAVSLTQSQLVSAPAERAELSKIDAKRALAALDEIVLEELGNAEKGADRGTATADRSGEAGAEGVQRPTPATGEEITLGARLPEQTLGQATHAKQNDIGQLAEREITTAERDLAHTRAALKQIPAKLPANELDPNATRATPRLARRALQMVCRLLAYNAELDLARRLNTYLADPDEYRTITRNLLHLGGTTTYRHQTITVTLDHPNPPRVARALRHLIDELNADPTHLPTDRRPITYQLKA
jgi:hypothetical protein